MNGSHTNGTLLGEADRCQGCGEVICDRHERKAQHEAHDGGWDFHNMVQRVTVTEVPNPAA